MAAPVRLQLSRKKGFNLQEQSRATNRLEAVNVSRPSRWGNPFTRDWFEFAQSKGFCKDKDCNTQLVRWFEAWLGGEMPEFGEPPAGDEIIKELRGKNLACWCKPGAPCHADVLLEIANADDGVTR